MSVNLFGDDLICGYYCSAVTICTVTFIWFNVKFWLNQENIFMTSIVEAIPNLTRSLEYLIKKLLVYAVINT